MAKIITEENFAEVLKSNRPVMIDCSATWCGPCRALAPIVEEVSRDYDGRADIYTMDVEECPAISAQYHIRNVPTVLFIKGGELRDKSVGLVPKNVLTEKIDALL